MNTHSKDLQADFIESMASVCAPLSIVTAYADGERSGTTVSAFASLSLDPPMVLVSLNRTSSLLPIARASGRFGLNILAKDQAQLGLQFARKQEDRFNGVDWELCEDVPRISDVGAWLACHIESEVLGGDHVILLGNVIRAESKETEPLTYYKRKFGTFVE